MDGYIGVGHGMKPDGTFDPGAVSGGLVEHDLAHTVVDAYAEAMQRSGARVAVERDSGAGHDPNFVGSVRRANQLRVKYADEVHFNASATHQGTGVEVLVDPRSSRANKETCKAMAAGIARVLGIPLRPNGGLLLTDRFSFVRDTRMPAAIIEVAFLDHTVDRRAITKEGALEAVGEEIAKARCAFLGATYRPPRRERRGKAIAAKRPSTSKRRAHRWARSRGAAPVFREIIDAGWSNAKRVGIDPAVFVAQAAKETGFGRFGGVLDPSFHNSGGLKTPAGGDDSDPRAHQRFRSWNAGTLAHCAHLALYAGVITPSRAKRLGDPRAFPSIHGVAPTVQQLGGTWAPSPDYGRSIVRDFLTPLHRG